MSFLETLRTTRKNVTVVDIVAFSTLVVISGTSVFMGETDVAVLTGGLALFILFAVVGKGIICPEEFDGFSP